LSWAFAALLWLLFAGLFRVTGILPVCLRVLATLRLASGLFLDTRLSDLEKERAARSAAKVLLMLFMSIIVRTGFAVLVPVAGAWVLDWLGVVPLDEVAARAESWPLVAFGAIAASSALYLRSERL
jgi:hypothetical protein